MLATRFAVAIHVLLLLACRRGEGPATSQLIAGSVNTNPVVVRRITGRLSRAGLLRVRRGPGGAELTRPPELITLGDVWLAMHEGQAASVLALHGTPNALCPVGGRVQAVLGQAFGQVDRAVLDALHRTTLAGLIAELGPKDDRDGAAEPMAG